MLSSLINKAQSFFKIGHERTLMIRKNIFYSFLIRGGSVLTVFLLTRITIDYVNDKQYGVWLVISGLVGWISTFDIGLGNGLRNKMAHSLALNERDNIVKYVSTTFAILFLIASGVFITGFIAGSFFNWNQLLNVNGAVSYSIWPIIVITLASFCTQFFLQPINSILIATHQQFKSSLVNLLGQLLSLLLVFLLTLFVKSNLTVLVIVIGGAPAVVFLLANIFYFSTSLKAYVPKFSAIDMGSAKSLMNAGGIFFLIQVGALILFETDNIVITRTLGPQDVTTFNLAYRYFSLTTTVFIIMLAPYWSAFTDAYAKKDMDWIKTSIKKMRQLWLGICGFALVLFVIAPVFYKIWIGDKVNIPTPVSFAMTIFMMVATWQGIYATALNGIGKLKIQLILVLVTAALNIPLSVVLIKLMGVSGTVVANIILSVIINIFLTYQVNLIINQKDTGIWSR